MKAIATILLASAIAFASGTSRTALTENLPPMDGRHLKITVEEVSYAPGQGSKPHTHGCPVTGYVIAGAIRFRVKGSAEVIYRPGDAFFEPANGIHEISANASMTEPARMVVFFLCDRNNPLSSPVEDRIR